MALSQTLLVGLADLDQRYAKGLIGDARYTSEKNRLEKRIARLNVS